MRKVVDYMVVVSGSNYGLEQSVKELLSESWELAGGICSDDRGFYQAMALYAIDTPPTEPADMSTKLYDMSLDAITKMRDLSKFVIDNGLQEQAQEMGKLPEFKALEKEIDALHVKL